MDNKLHWRSEHHHWFHGWMRVESSAMESAQCNKEHQGAFRNCSVELVFEQSASAKLDAQDLTRTFKIIVSFTFASARALWATDNTWYEFVVSIYMTPVMMSPIWLMCPHAGAVQKHVHSCSFRTMCSVCQLWWQVHCWVWQMHWCRYTWINEATIGDRPSVAVPSPFSPSDSWLQSQSHTLPTDLQLLSAGTPPFCIRYAAKEVECETEHAWHCTVIPSGTMRKKMSKNNNRIWESLPLSLSESFAIHSCRHFLLWVHLHDASSDTCPNGGGWQWKRKGRLQLCYVWTSRVSVSFFPIFRCAKSGNMNPGLRKTTHQFPFQMQLFHFP